MTTTPRPLQDGPAADYPTREEWHLDRRRFIGAVGLGIAGAGLATAIGNAGDPKRAVAKKRPDRDPIAAAVKNLGHEDFRTRKKATKTLVALGKGEGATGKGVKVQKEKVLAAMKPLLKSKDPEVVQRAKAILLALTPPKKKQPPPRQIEMVDGGMVIEID